MPATHDRQRFQLQDLVLRVKPAVDRAKWDEDRYEAFLDGLCAERDYQKEAIRTALRYLLGGEYATLRALALANWDTNNTLHDRYGSWEGLEQRLQLPNQRSGSLDMATGSGKSYVIYGIAAILLAEGAADRVLVLCPSTTIETGLLEKFRRLAGDADLQALLPTNAKIAMPRIIDASQTITVGCICVENRDAVYEHVKSSIKDSLWGKGANVAVLNDEAHHVANEPEAKVKRWKEFLQSPDYGFRTVLGFSGTCYAGNEYFSDVIYRYSLREAMEQRFVKLVRYVAEQPTTGEEDERWQLVHNRHERLRAELRRRDLLPLTIVVTPTIKKCELVGEELRDFLTERGGLTEEEARKRVLVVYNNAPDVPKLRAVDEPTSEVEWIVSVSMLNEGWDVKRVFQIVPHEERAFNSKLLIAQVLGRGLRVPEGWRGAQAEVTVFNHAAWASGIRHLVNEILENERRLSSKIVADSPYNFTLHNLTYNIITRAEERKRTGAFTLLRDERVDLPSEGETIDVSIDFEQALTAVRDPWKTVISRKVYTPEEVAGAMSNVLEKLDLETASLPDPAENTRYAKDYPYERLLRIVRNSLQGDTVVSEGNRQRLLQALGTVRRTGTKVVRYEFDPHDLVTLSTAERPTESVGASQLRADKVAFVTDATRKSLAEEQREFFDAVREPDSEFRRYPIANAHDFKCPLNMAIADAGTERNFLRELIMPANVAHLDAWIKSTATGFYGIDYAWKKGNQPKRGTFNPDFFIKVGALILVVEIKDEGELRDPSPENVKKNEYAVAHFAKLNARLAGEGVDKRYHFHFLAPPDIPEFFKRLREGTIASFRSALDVKLKQVSTSLAD